MWHLNILCECVTLLLLEIRQVKELLLPVDLHGGIYDAAPSGPQTSLHSVTVINATHCYP